MGRIKGHNGHEYDCADGEEPSFKEFLAFLEFSKRYLPEDNIHAVMSHAAALEVWDQDEIDYLVSIDRLKVY